MQIGLYWPINMVTLSNHILQNIFCTDKYRLGKKYPKYWLLQVYLVLGVVSLYQSDFEPTVQFDHRQLLHPASGSVKGGGGILNSGSGSERKRSGDRNNGVRFAFILSYQVSRVSNMLNSSKIF